MKFTLFVLSAIMSLQLAGQSTPTMEAQPIVVEGKLLYRLEMASWYGTDMFIEKYENRGNIGGYFSYVDGGLTKCIFFSRSELPKVIGTIAFDSTYSTESAKMQLTERDFTLAEKDVYLLRGVAMKIVNSDTMFRVYDNTSLNMIPLIEGGKKRVYILTGPKEAGVVIFGNDYLLSFDDNNTLIEKKALHISILPLYISEDDEKKGVIGTAHTHLEGTGDFITATDICTLMLYSRFTSWKTHTVVSEKYINIWDCEAAELTVLPRN